MFENSHIQRVITKYDWSYRIKDEEKLFMLITKKTYLRRISSYKLDMILNR